MVQKRAERGIIILVGVFFLLFVVVACNYYKLAVQQQYVRAAEQRSELDITAGVSQGTIYDCNMKPLVNAGVKYQAVAVPSAVDREETAKYAVDKNDFYKKFDSGVPFSFECRKGTPESEGLTVFEIPERYSENQIAQHVVGYISENSGVSGIEYAYDRILRGDYGENKVTYSIDGFGRVLIGDGKVIQRSDAAKGGVVTTIDSDIQRICEECGSDIEKGSIVAADIKTGDILAMASFPDYSSDSLEKVLADERSPLINRSLYSYGVGSIFKLVTSCEAINENLGGYIYDCEGSISVDGQNFNCHKHDGHELQNMTQAITKSCNTYFISLSRSLDVDNFRRLAYSLGFGREVQLCAGITGSAGVLPTVSDLMIPAELANFSFGQGKLTATPLQITQLTCAIANYGEMPSLRLIKGVTLDGEEIANEKNPQLTRVIESETSYDLRQMMISAIRDNEESNARTKYMSVGAKTSTAQTGRYDENGEELCHAWITGFFPAYAPKYAVTVLVEDGGYGNDAAAPIFSEIADKIALELS